MYSSTTSSSDSLARSIDEGFERISSWTASSCSTYESVKAVASIVSMLLTADGSDFERIEVF